MFVFGLAGMILGVILMLFAAFMIFFFPAAGEHQPHGFGWNGVLVGFVAGIAGVALVLLP